MTAGGADDPDLPRWFRWFLRKQAQAQRRERERQARIEGSRVGQKLRAWRETAERQKAAMRRQADAASRERGFGSHDHERAVRKLKKAGYRHCVACQRDVVPRPRATMLGFVTLGLVNPGRAHCPRCGGVLFRAPEGRV